LHSFALDKTVNESLAEQTAIFCPRDYHLQLAAAENSLATQEMSTSFAGALKKVWGYRGFRGGFFGDAKRGILHPASATARRMFRLRCPANWGFER